MFIFLFLSISTVWAQSPCCVLLSSAGISSSLPLIVIDTFNTTVVDTYRIPARICTCGAPSEFDETAAIEIRGSSSARESAKKSFSFKVVSNHKKMKQNMNDEDIDAPYWSFMGFPQATSFSLYGPENDRTLGMRNWMSMWIAREAMGRYASRTAFAEVYLVQDGFPLSLSHYWGVYLAMEKIERGMDKVNISALKPNDVDISGGYIIRFEHGKVPHNESVSFTASLNPSPPGTSASSLISRHAARSIRPLPYLLTYPDMSQKKWTTAPAANIKARVMTYISNTMAMIELSFLTLGNRSDSSVSVMSSPLDSLALALASLNSRGGWRDLVDETAFIDYFLVTEISKNPDGYRGSVYAHKDKYSKLSMGPVHDYNEAYGLCCGYPIEGYQRGGKSNGTSGGSAISSNGWRFNICEEKERCLEDKVDGVSLWYTRAFNLDPLFKRSLTERWRVLRSEGGSLSNQVLIGEMDKQKALLSASGALLRNHQRWAAVLGTSVDQFQEGVETMKEWLKARLSWIDLQLLSIITKRNKV